MKHIIILFAFIFTASAISAQTVIARPETMTINAVLDCVPTTIPAAQQAEARDNLTTNYYLTISALRQFDDGMDEVAIQEEAAAQTYSVLQGWYQAEQTAKGMASGYGFDLKVINPIRFFELNMTAEQYADQIETAITKAGKVKGYSIEEIKRRALYWGVQLNVRQL
jgi:hypothetical protein